MSARITSRGFLLVTSGGTFAAVLAAFAIAERPGLGLGHYFYLPVVLLALAAGPRCGTLAGVLATSLFALGTGLNPHLQLDAESLPSVAIRLSMYVAAGLVTGAFAQTTRRVNAQLETLAERDHLTGLYNARAFEAALARRVGRQAPFALLLFDMDNLKAVNDTHGHRAGSDAIQNLGTMLSRLVRESDHVSRVGGDEFTVLCSPATEPGAQAFAERLGRSLAESGVPASFGWALFPSDGDEPISLYRTADDRLYAEKARGKRAALPSAG